MENKVIVKKLIIISIIILIIGAILGFGIRILMLKSLAEQNIPNENTAGVGGDYSAVIEIFGEIFTAFIGIGIFIISVIIDLIIWIVYAIISFIRKRKQKSLVKNEKTM